MLRAAIPLSAFGLAALALLSVASCADETIVLASIPASDSGVQVPPPTRCVDNTSCPAGYYCSMAQCGAATGTCVLPPVFCDPTEAPVCGCDHVTYFNDCLRQAGGIAASTPQPCQENAILCAGPGGTSPCPDGALCAQLGFTHGPCLDDIPGTCWVLPASCPTTAPSDYWDSCSSTGAQCIDTCGAIRAGGVYRRSRQCP